MRFWLIILCGFIYEVEAANTIKNDSLSRQFKNLGFSAGTLTEFVGFVQNDTKGTRDRFAWNPYVGFSLDIELPASFRLIPEMNWVLPRESGNSGIKKNLFMFRMDGAYPILDELRLRFGTSLMVQNIRGPGGTQNVSNGSGTSSFYVPSESQTSLNNTLDFGADFFITKAFSVRFQSFIYSAFKNESRQWSYILGGTYFYDLQSK
jgi:hypothetical protein